MPSGAEVGAIVYDVAVLGLGLWWLLRWDRRSPPATPSVFDERDQAEGTVGE